jgi:phage protein D
MPEAGIQTGIASARPTFTVDGETKEGLAEDLMAMRVEETTDGLYACEVTLSNWGPQSNGEVGFAYLDRELLDFGTTLKIEALAGEERQTIFEGRVTGLESQVPGTEAPSVVVLAEDRLQDLRMTRRTRTFEDVSDRDVAQQIADDHNLDTDFDLDGPTHRVLAQVNQSDLAFLRDRARAADAEVWVEGKTLHVQARSRRDAGELTLSAGKALHAFTGRADLAHQQTEFTVSGWDAEAKESIAETADESAIQSEVNGGLSGASALEDALGARTEQMVHTAPATVPEARAVAEATFRQQARRFVEARGTAEGDARLRVGAQVEMGGVGGLFEGSGYTVTEVRHTFNLDDGYRTHFTAQRPYVNR